MPAKRWTCSKPVSSQQSLLIAAERLVTTTKRRSRWALPDPTPQASHHAVGAITLIPLLLQLLVGRIDLSFQRRPATNPHVDLLRIEVAGQRLQPVDVDAFHDPWLRVEMRRDSRGKRRSWLGGSARWLTRSPCVEMV